MPALMRPLICTLFVIAVSALSFAADAKTDVLAVLKTQQDAWNRADLKTFMEGYENSPDITFVGKTVSRGYAGLTERYTKAYGTKEKMGDLTFSELEFTPLGKDNALVIGRFQLKRSEAGGGDASGRFTLIFRKTAKGWKAIHDHTSAD